MRTKHSNEWSSQERCISSLKQNLRKLTEENHKLKNANIYNKTQNECTQKKFGHEMVAGNVKTRNAI